MDPVMIMTAAIVGVVVGALLGWFLGSRRGSDNGRLENELRLQLAAREEEAARLRTAESQLNAEKAAALTARVAADEQLATARQQLREGEAQREQLRTQAQQESSALAAARAEVDAAHKFIAEKEALHQRQLKDAREAHDKSIADLREAFKAMSADALKENAPEFLRLANESFAKFQEASKGDLAKRQEAIAGLIKPLEENLKTYQERLQAAERSQSSALGEVKKQLETLTTRSESLASETERFRMVLKSNSARGRWGEETLRRVVEAAGMSRHCDFIEQVAEGDKKPDMIVRLPGDRVIIVDAKVPDLDFLDAMDAADAERRSQSLQTHAQKLKATIRDLAGRDYPGQFPNALDYVVLFLPAESLFSAALEGDRDLIVWAAERRIMIATPASLIALLRSVSVSWLQFDQTQNAQQIADAAREFYARVAKFYEHFGKIRAGLSRANESFNDAVGSYERMVRPSGERLQELGGAPADKPLLDLAPIDTTLRIPAGEE